MKYNSKYITFKKTLNDNEIIVHNCNNSVDNCRHFFSLTLAVRLLNTIAAVI